MVFSQYLELFIAISLAFYLPLLAVDFGFKKQRFRCYLISLLSIIVILYVFNMPILVSNNSEVVTNCIITCLSSACIVFGFKFGIIINEYKRLVVKLGKRK